VDAITNWTLKAKMLHGHGGPLRGALADGFLANPEYAYAHREYPLGLPSLQAFDFHLMGRADTEVVHVQLVLLLAAFLAVVWVFLRSHVDPVVLAAGLGLVLAAPSVQSKLLTGYADVPLAAYVIAAALALGTWLAGGRDDTLVLSGLFAAAAVATKQEGTFFVAVLLVGALVAALLARDRGRVARIGALGLAVAATAVPWQVYATTNDLFNRAFDPSPAQVASRLDTLPEIAAALARGAVADGWLHAVPLAFAGALVVMARDRGRQLAAAYLATIAALTAVLFFVYLSTADYVDLPRLLAQSANRVVATPVLFSATLLPLLLSRAFAEPFALDACEGAAVRREPSSIRRWRRRGADSRQQTSRARSDGS
jgi:hypothetical protein